MKKTIQRMAVWIAGGLMASSCAWGQANYATPYTFVTIAGSTYGSANGLNGAGLLGYPAAIDVDVNDNVYVTDVGNYTVVQISPAGGTNWQVTIIGGAADNFSEPEGVAVDTFSNLYVADTGNNVLRLMTPSGGTWPVTTIAGTTGFFGGDADGTNSAAEFSAPSGIAVDTFSNLYVADTDNNIIREAMPVGTNWVVTTLAGSGPPTSHGSVDGTNQVARFWNPSGMAVDHSGNLFVADTENNTIREIVPMGTNWVVTTIAGNASVSGNDVDGTNTAALFNNPNSIAVDANDNLYVADEFNNAIRMITPVGTNWVTTTLGGAIDNSSGASDGTGTNASFNLPYGITVDSHGNIFVADFFNSIVREGFPPAPATLPNLTMSLGAGGSVVVSWPGTGGTLQTNSDLNTSNWAAYGGTISNSSGTNSVTLTPAGTALYFRLATSNP